MTRTRYVEGMSAARIDASDPGKPLLRGVFHEIAAPVALAASALLALAAAPGRARAAAVVYGTTLFALFLTSALYHRPNWPPRARLLMRRLDHAAILLLIAGTYTPFCLVLGGKTGNALLVVIWVGAALGLLRAILWAHAPRPLVAAIYVLLGWVVVPVMPSLLAVLGTPAVALLGAGGLVYTLGAVVYATQRPDPFPKVLGYHEVFHAMVIAAAALHFAVVAMAIGALG